MGQVVQQYWDAIPTQLPLVELDKFVVMPNHVHGIVVITDIDHTVGSNVGAKNFRPTVCEPSYGYKEEAWMICESLIAFHVLTSGSSR